MCSSRTSLHSMALVQLSSIIDKRTKLTLAAVSRTQLAVWIVQTEILLMIRSLKVRFAVNAILLKSPEICVVLLERQ